MSATTLREQPLAELRDEIVAALERGLVVLVPHRALSEVPPHRYGLVRALEDYLFWGGAGVGAILGINLLALFDEVALMAPVRMRQAGLDGPSVHKKLWDIAREGATDAEARELADIRYPLPGTHLHVLGIDGRFA